MVCALEDILKRGCRLQVYTVFALVYLVTQAASLLLLIAHEELEEGAQVLRSHPWTYTCLLATVAWTAVLCSIIKHGADANSQVCGKRYEWRDPAPSRAN